MKLRHDFEGVSESGDGNFKPIPVGKYVLRIVDVKDGTTRNGDPMANVRFVVTEGSFAGRGIFHNVSFLPKDNDGAGIAKHFLHVIGEPYEGDDVDIDTDRWFEKLVNVEVGIGTYTDKKGKKKTKNYIERFILEEGDAFSVATSANQDKEDTPF